jgi:hypothetical protein
MFPPAMKCCEEVLDGCVQDIAHDLLHRGPVNDTVRKRLDHYLFRSSRFCAKLGGFFATKVFINQDVMMIRESICPERSIYSSRK